MEIFENYLAAIENEEHRFRMREVLEWVNNRFPDMQPKIAWNQPMFTDHGTFIIGSVCQNSIFLLPWNRRVLKCFIPYYKSGYSHGSNIFRIG